MQLADYYDISDRLIITSPEMTAAVGVPREMLQYIYNSFDVQISTTLGEGFGLPQLEGMACGVPQIVPDWSALGEWARDGAVLIPCTSTQANSGGLNTIGGIADKELFIAALNRIYTDKEYKAKMGFAASTLARRPQFNWDTIANQFDDVFKKVTRA